jgi:hypothetical protein
MSNRKIFWVLGITLVVCAWFHFFGNRGERPRMIITASLRPTMNRGARGARRGGPGRDGNARGGAGRNGSGRGGNSGSPTDNGANFPVLFELLNPYQLTSVKVIEVVTNQGTGPEHILWHLVSTNGSNPVKVFFYGRNIEGMGPYLPGVTAEALIPHVAYRLDLEAGKIKGSTVFQTTEMTP